MDRPRATPLTGGISIVIVTFAAAPQMLEEAVDSVLASVADLSLPVAVEVVDNGDQAADRLRAFRDRIAITSTGHNGGFAAAVNTGFRHGIERGARFVACLNDDVVVTPGWLTPLIDALEQNSALGGVQPLLVNPETGLIDSAGVQIDKFGAGSDRLRDQPADAAQPEEIAAVTGGAMVARSALVDEIGYLDERFFLYYEDVEWCLRGAAAGWRFAVVPASVVAHRGSATTIGLGDRVLTLQERNRLWTAAMHLGWRQNLAAVGLSLRRVRHRPHQAHLRALGAGAVGMAPRLFRRWRNEPT